MCLDTQTPFHLLFGRREGLSSLSDHLVKDSLWHSSPALNSLSPDLRYEDSVSVVGKILSQDDICSFDTVLVVDQLGVCASVPLSYDADIIKQLRSSDLHALPTSSSISTILKTAPSSKQYPHVKHSTSSSVQEIAESVARRCGSTWTTVSPATGPLNLAENTKHVVCINMPAMEGSLKYRKATMLGYGAFTLS